MDWLKRRFATETSQSTGIRGAGESSQAKFGEAISENDLLFAVQREPVAHRIVFTVAHDIFDNWFKVEEVAEKPDPNFDKQVQKVLSALNAKSVFTQMAVLERLFGWSIIILGFVDYGKDLATPVETPQEIREIAAYSYLEVEIQSADEEKKPDDPRFGLPVLYTLKRIGQQPVKVHYARVIHFATRLLDHPYKGLSVLEPVYDDLTVLRNIRWGMGQTMFRYGSGFPDIEIQGATKKQLDDFEASQQFKNLNARTYFLHNEKQKVEFKGLAGQTLNPEPYYMPVMENISAGSGIPMAILRGAQAGALTGSEVNEREYFKLVSDAQSRYEPGIRYLIDALIECGQIKPRYHVRREYRIIWQGGFEINEKDKALTELSKAQRWNIASNWMTINELRAAQEPALDPAEGPDGEVIPGLLKLQQGALSRVFKEVEK